MGSEQDAQCSEQDARTTARISPLLTLRFKCRTAYELLSYFCLLALSSRTKLKLTLEMREHLDLPRRSVSLAELRSVTRSVCHREHGTVRVLGLLTFLSTVYRIYVQVLRYPTS